MVRFKQRYLLAQVLMEPGRELNTKDVYSAITNRVAVLFGVWGFGAVKASLQIKHWATGSGYLIVRVTRSFARLVWVAMSSIKELGNRACVVSVVHCGGTIRGTKLAQLAMMRAKMRLAN